MWALYSRCRTSYLIYLSLPAPLIDPLLLYCKHSRSTAPPVAMGIHTYLSSAAASSHTVSTYSSSCPPLLWSHLCLFVEQCVCSSLCFCFCCSTSGCCYISTFSPVCLLGGDNNDCDQWVPPTSLGCCSDPQRWTLPHRDLLPPGAETRGCSPRHEGRPHCRSDYIKADYG